MPKMINFGVFYKGARMTLYGVAMDLKPFHMVFYDSFVMFERIFTDFEIFRFLYTRARPPKV